MPARLLITPLLLRHAAWESVRGMGCFSLTLLIHAHDAYLILAPLLTLHMESWQPCQSIVRSASRRACPGPGQLDCRWIPKDPVGLIRFFNPRPISMADMQMLRTLHSALEYHDKLTDISIHSYQVLTTRCRWAE
jgi:hypothetical protein